MLPVQPMVARPAPALPQGGPWAFEPKLDGWRVLTEVAAGRVQLWSRHQRSLTRYFPEIVEALRAWFGGQVTLDGELIACRPGGRLDFAALQHHITGGRRAPLTAPAGYVAFDALAAGGTDWRGYPYSVRRMLLERLLDGAEPPLAVVPMTRDGIAARAWLTGHLDLGVEGVVAKRVNHAYSTRHAWMKIRTRSTAEAVVGGVLGSLDRPDALILGRPDHQGRLRVAGRTTPLPSAVRTELAGVLIPAVGDHPWPPTIPSGRFGQLPSTPIEYLQVAPITVVELDVDTAFEHSRWRHGVRVVRIRADLRPTDLL